MALGMTNLQLKDRYGLQENEPVFEGLWIDELTKKRSQWTTSKQTC